MIIDIQTEKEVYTEDMTIGLGQKAQVELPDFIEGTPVYVNNRESLLFLEHGKVADRDHKYCRVKFISSDPRLNGFLIWIPGPWLRPLPKELVSDARTY